MRGKVSIVKCSNYEDENKVKASVARAIELIGGIKKYIKPGTKVLLKPNICANASSLSGATTDPSVLAGVIEVCKSAVVKDIIIGESSIIGNDTTEAFYNLGMDYLIGGNISFVDLERDDKISVDVPEGRIFKKMSIPKTVLECDAIINIPVIKIHPITKITCCLKNMKGATCSDVKKICHLKGLNEGIADINSILKPVLNVVDGVIGMEGLAPINGTPVNLGIIVAGDNPVSTDYVISKIIGINPNEVDHIVISSKRGYGTISENEIELFGETIENVKKIVQMPDINRVFQNVTVFDGNACSGCSGSVFIALRKMEKSGEIKELMKNYTNINIYKGTNAVPSRKDSEVDICIGNCLKKQRYNSDLFVPGCPPQGNLIQDFIRKYLLNMEPVSSTEDMLIID